jgi:hypothetical protein
MVYSSVDGTYVVPVAGRGRLTARAEVSAEGVHIRLDDGRNPEFWAAVGLPEELLRQLLIDVQQQREEASRDQ